MVVTLSVAEFVAFKVRYVATFVESGLVLHAGTGGHLVSERSQRTIIVDPIVAHFVRPLLSGSIGHVLAVHPLPLRVKVPTQRDRPTPKNSVFKKKFIQLFLRGLYCDQIRVQFVS